MTGGTGGTVVISGATGSGKTALLHTLADLAAPTCGLVLLDEGAHGGVNAPLRVFADLRHHGTPPPEAPTALDELLRDGTLAEAAADPVVAEWMEIRLARELGRILAEVSVDGPTLLMIDDVHHADASSLRVLLHLIRRARTMPLLVVLAESDHFRHAQQIFRTELLRDDRCHRIHLDRLTGSGVAALVADQLDDVCTAELYALSGGNPLLVHALLADQLGPGRTGCNPTATGLMVGDAYRHAVATCISRTGPVVLAAACGMALLGGTAAPETLACVLDVEITEMTRAIQELEDIGLLDGGRFRHPAAAEVVVSALPTGQRRDLHWRVAQHLQDIGAQATSIARHLIASERAVDGWTLPVMLEAAQEADLADDIPLAVECLNLADFARLSVHDQDLLRVGMVRTQWRSNPASAMRHLAPLTEAALDGRLPIRDAEMLLRALLWHGDLGAAGEVVTWLSNAVAGGDRLALSRLRGAQLRLRSFYPDLSDLRPAVADIDAASFTYGARAGAVLAEALTRGADESTVTAAEQLLRGASLDDENIDAIEAALFALLCAGQADRAAECCGPLLEEATSRGAATWQARLAAIQGEIALRQGDPFAADKWARAALTHISARSWSVAVCGPQSTIVLAAVSRGRLDIAGAELRRALPPAVNRTLYGLMIRYARGRYHLARGRWFDALADFVGCGTMIERWGLHLPTLIPWQAGAAEVYTQIGMSELAREVTEKGLSAPGGGCDASDAGDGDPRRQGLMSTGATPVGAQGWAASSVEGPGGAQLQELDRPGSGHDDHVLLSEAERRVAELAAIGRTNREVAQALFITVSTVEQHLTHTYRKLQLNGRSELFGRFPPSTADGGPAPMTAPSSVDPPGREWDVAVAR